MMRVFLASALCLALGAAAMWLLLRPSRGYLTGAWFV